MLLLGNLAETPLGEVLGLLRHKEGALEVWRVKGFPSTTLYLKPGWLRSVDQKGKPLEPLQAKAILYALFQAREGNFEFIPKAKPPHAFRLHWSLEGLILNLTTLHDEMERYRPHLPPPGTLFCWQGAISAEGGFWEKARPYLLKGASAQELAQALDMPLDLVRLLLFQGTRKGLLVPLRPGSPRPLVEPRVLT